MSVAFKTWEEMFLAVLKDPPNLFYVIKHPTEYDRTRFMDKAEVLSYIKLKIVETSKR